MRLETFRLDRGVRVFKDDKMISLLTAILLMVLIGTVIQRADGLSDFFGGETDAPEAVEVVAETPSEAPADVLALKGERVSVPLDVLARIDVLANETGLTLEQKSTLTVVTPPACGRVFVQDRALQYLSESSCTGVQTLDYAVQIDGTALTATLEIMVDGGQPLPPDRVAASGASATEPDRTTQEQSSSVAAPLPARTGSAGTGAPSATGTEPEHATLGSLAQTEGVQKLRRGSGENALVAPRVTAPAEPEQPRLLDTSGPAMPAVAASTGTVRRASELAALRRPETSLHAERPQPRVSQASGDDPAHLNRAPDLAEDGTPAGDGTGSGRVVAEMAATAVEWLSEVTAPANTDTGIAGAGGTDFLIAYVEVQEPRTVPPTEPSVRAVVPERAIDAVPEPDAIVQIVRLTPANAPIIDIVPAAALATLPVDPNEVPYEPARAETSPAPAVSREADSAVQPVPEGGPVKTASLDPVTQTGPAPSVPVPAARPAATASPVRDACAIPPATTLDIRRAAQTALSVLAPCHADTVAELTYSGLKFAMPIDSTGKGSILTLGFEANAPALLTFVDGSKVDFDLPYKGIDRVSRVALIWDVPVSLELNAVEFGGGLDTAGHVRPDNRRSFSDVRRTGGGFLTSYRSAFGVGQNAEIYSFYRKRGGTTGIVQMMIDFTSRNRDRLKGTCGDGIYAAPQFLVLRSDRGVLERPVIRKLAAMDCSEITREVGDKRLISSAVADLVISEN